MYYNAIYVCIGKIIAVRINELSKVILKESFPFLLFINSLPKSLKSILNVEVEILVQLLA